MVVLLLITAGCALSPMDRESREYERIDAQNRAAERFESFQCACRAAGGIVIVNSEWGRIQPRASDMKMARCGAAIHNALR
jgi:hypothetical protein